MKRKGDIILVIISLLLVVALRYTYKFDSSKEILISTAAHNVTSVTASEALKITPLEKRGTPTYDYITGTDRLFHYRVFFWVPKGPSKLTPYADIGVITNVSNHGPVEKWSVVDTGKINKDEKLVFVYVPKTFIFFHGNGFEKLIHLKYETIKK